MHVSNLFLIFLAQLVTTSIAVDTVAELELESSSAILKLHSGVLQGDSYRDILCHVITVCGKRGVQKSTLLRSLGVNFSMAHADFDTNDRGIATTTSVDVSDVSSDNNIIFDMLGNDDSNFAMEYGLEASAVDRALSQLVAPIANVLIYVSVHFVDCCSYVVL